jgi:serine/threonine protein kinase/CheY-like chemotaxis protein
MSPRVLVIDDDPLFRRLLAQHIKTGFDAPSIAEHDPSSSGGLPPDFRAGDYDAVLLTDRAGEPAGLEWLQELAGRAGFPPIIHLTSTPSAEARASALRAGAYACLSRQKIDHNDLVDALRRARGSARPALSGTEQLERLCRFGDLTIPGYRFIRTLAESVVSGVYLAQSMKLDIEVVLKVLREAPEADGAQGDNFDRFLREYDIASGIRHPNIVRIFDFGAGDHYAYIVMEYFPRGDLRARIKQGIRPREAVALLRQMAEALQVLHEAGVLHRDLKPGNVMLHEDGSVVLIDFGMSRKFDLATGLTDNGKIFGTPDYMSPEQGHGRETDERSDLYSLGIIFYEMLMRRKPYVADSPMQVIYRHANSPLPELTPELRSFEPILHGCIAKDREQRYPSAAALVGAVREAEGREDERAGQAG